MVFIALLSFNFFGQALRENIALILAIGVGVLIYGVLIYFMRIPEVDRTIEVIKKGVREMIAARKKDRG